MTIFKKTLPTELFFDTPLLLESYIRGRLADPVKARERSSKKDSDCLIVLTVHSRTETTPPVFCWRNNYSANLGDAILKMVTNFRTGNEQNTHSFESGKSKNI